MFTASSGHKKEINPEDAPSILLFPLLSTPSVLQTGHLDKLPLIIKGHKRIDIAKGRLVYSGSLSINYHYDLIIFSRMLAKIAHSFATAELGSENFTPLLLEIILNKDLSYIGSLIGQSVTPNPKTVDRPSLHHIWIEITDDRAAPMSWKWVVVRIQLFKPWSDVIYIVVAGRATATRSILKWKGLSRLTSAELEEFRQQHNIHYVADNRH